MFSLRTEQLHAPNGLSMESLLELAGDAVFRLDRSGNIFFGSRRAHLLLDGADAVPGAHLTRYIAPEDVAAVEAGLIEATESDTTARINARMSLRDGAHWFELQITRCASEDRQYEFLVVARDIAEQHATEERLRHLATHDDLTGLPNRALLSDRLRMAFAQARRVGIGFSVLALDLDGFKKVNDALGHAVGDALLRVAGARFRTVLRNVDTLARVGGDEFVAVLPAAVDVEELQIVARRMISTTQLPFEIDGQVLYVGASIGAATYPQHGDNEVKLLAHADTALYRAKETGKSRCVVYDPPNSPCRSTMCRWRRPCTRPSATANSACTTNRYSMPTAARLSDSRR